MIGDSDLSVCVVMEIERLSSLKNLGKVRKRKKKMEFEDNSDDHKEAMNPTRKL